MASTRACFQTLLAAAAWLLGTYASAAGYSASGSCQGFPRVQIKAPAGYCVGLVADERQGLKFPRRLIEVAPGRFWIVDMGGWDSGRGRLLEMTLPAPGSQPVIKVLADKLDRPHGLAIGPDGKAYVGEATKIWRTPVAANGFKPETVVGGLPGDGAHPLKEIAFGSGGKLYINIGSFSDSCRNEQQQQPVPCPEVAGDKPRAAVYEAVLAGPNWQLRSLKPFAAGLRNSMALAVHRQAGRDDVVLQGENSIDYPQAGIPREEFNVLARGGNYGWPYCVENQRASRGYEDRFDCRATRSPASLWPAHAAPLHMLLAPAAASSPAPPWSASLLVAWHGHRPAGQRVMAFKVGAAGQLVGQGNEMLGSWAAKAGVSPQGAPTGLALDSAGRLWVVEDRNHTVLVVGPDK